MSPELRTGPDVGQEPLFVNFTALMPLTDLDAIGNIVSASWNFGDGSPAINDTDSETDDITKSSAKHFYQSAGDYTASLILTGANGSRTLMSPNIHVQRILPDTLSDAPTHQIIVAGLVGSLAAPLSNSNVIERSAVRSVNQSIQVRQSNGSYSDILLANVAAAVVPQESKRDAAGFDIDRPPLIAATNASDFHLTSGDLEDSDFAAQLYVSGDGSAGLPFRFRVFNPDEDPPGDHTPGTFNTYIPPEYGGNPTPERFRIFTTLGGTVFSPEATRVGDLILQTGRVEP